MHWRSLPIYLANFFFSLHFAITLYINSSFLKHFLSTPTIGLLYVIGAIGNTFLFFQAPRILKAIGGGAFFFLSLMATLVASIGAAFSTTPFWAVIFFLLYASVAMMIYYNLDLLLEEVSPEGETGEIRGVYMTMDNAAVMGGPLLISLLGEGRNFSQIYLASAALLIPIFLLLAFGLRLRHPKAGMGKNLPWSAWKENFNLRRITYARFTLELFYALMTIFVPIYLHEKLNFDWTQIGIIFTVMLMPFILIEWPAGELADRRLGEKEMLLLGFFFAGLSVIPMVFLGKTAFYWTVFLFLSRVGASLIEIMTETYFFKHVNQEDTGLISIFRLSRPGGLIAGALIGALTVTLYSYNALFLILAIILFFGMIESVRLVDTR